MIDPAVPPDQPRIYVACLASYNAGVLHGAWIDADQPVEAIYEDVQAMLAASPENRTCQWCGAVLTETVGIVHWDKPCTHAEHWPGNAEEFAIHDYEGFGSLRLSEYESLERVAAIAAGIAEHGDAFAAWLSYEPDRDVDVQAFEDAYRGEWDSLRGYAEDFAESAGLYDLAEKTSSAYVRVDIEALERDLEIDLYVVQTPRRTVHVFDPNV